jgi:hypothetical protein
MPEDRSQLSEEFLSARNALTVHSGDVRHGPESLFGEWFRMRTAGARCTVDPTAGVSFSDVIEAVITCRLTGQPIVWPAPKAK